MTTRTTLVARASLLLIAAAVVVKPAAAQTAGEAAAGFAVNRFEPSERGSEWFVSESLDLRGHSRPAVGVLFGGAYRPLAIYDRNDEVRTALIEHQVLAYPGGSLVLFDRLRLAMTLPFVLYQSGESGSLRGVNYAAPDRSSVGDLRLSTDVRLTGEKGDALTTAIGVSAFLPTGSRTGYTGDGAARVRPRAMIAGDVGAFAYAGQLGLLFRGHGERFADAPVGTEMTFSASGGVRLLDKRLLVGPELFGSTVLAGGGAFARRTTPFEAILGAHYAIGDVRFGAGGGLGLTRGLGAPLARWMLSFEWVPGPSKGSGDRDFDAVPDADDACPDVPGLHTSDPRTNGCPAPIAEPPARPDTDGDGVLDAEDACPRTPGVKTSVAATNGCPDGDGDGIVDRDDACPNEAGPDAEDPAARGCPDADADGIVDKVDACRDEKGVATTDPKTNGCPPNPDRDGDGIRNEEDACPDESGRPDSDPKKHGCPTAFIEGSQIRIREQVKFVTGSAEIQRGQDNELVLSAVLAVLKDHPAITKVRVEGHTDSRGAAAKNKALSQRRAESVVAWLVKNGIDASRLEARGFGMERPIDDNRTDAGRKNNRRVEFHIDVDDGPARAAEDRGTEK
jgi:outer membrane protein OmpA-like peptidoglycan-associated protein